MKQKLVGVAARLSRLAVSALLVAGWCGVVATAQAAAKPTATTTTISFGPTALVGSPVSVTATIAPAPGAGTVTFSAQVAKSKVTLPTSCHAVSVTGTAALCTFTPTVAGSYKFTAAYSGSSVYGKSSGAAQETVWSPVPTTVSVSDNASPPAVDPVTFGGTIVFTATVAATGSQPNGSVQWSLAGEGPDYANAGSGIAGACQGAVPLVNGTATCSVTPTDWYDTDNSADTPYYWPIDATATFTPAADSAFVGGGGADSTSKLSVAQQVTFCGDSATPNLPCIGQPQSPYVPVNDTTGQPFWVAIAATDALQRTLDFYWDAPGPVVTQTPYVEADLPQYPGWSSWSFGAVCPHGILPWLGDAQPWSGSFECQYRPGASVTFYNVS